VSIGVLQDEENMIYYPTKVIVDVPTAVENFWQFGTVKIKKLLCNMIELSSN